MMRSTLLELQQRACSRARGRRRCSTTCSTDRSTRARAHPAGPFAARGAGAGARGARLGAAGRPHRARPTTCRRCGLRGRASPRPARYRSIAAATSVEPARAPRSRARAGLTLDAQPRVVESWRTRHRAWALRRQGTDAAAGPPGLATHLHPADARRPASPWCCGDLPCRASTTATASSCVVVLAGRLRGGGDVPVPPAMTGTRVTRHRG